MEYSQTAERRQSVYFYVDQSLIERSRNISSKFSEVMNWALNKYFSIERMEFLTYRQLRQIKIKNILSGVPRYAILRKVHFLCDTENYLKLSNSCRGYGVKTFLLNDALRQYLDAKEKEKQNK